MAEPRSPCGLVLLATPGVSTDLVHRALEAAFGPVPAIIERPNSRVTTLRRRARRLGWRTALGQALFMVLIPPFLTRRDRSRIEQIVASIGIDLQKPTAPTCEVPSVNSDEARTALLSLAPAVVVVNGTRIISPQTLSTVEAPFVNMHAGITPRYRGVHGGYWALVEGRRDLVGTTIHLVDKGVDTGPILRQVTFDVTDADSFVTYPFLHLAAGIPALVESVKPMLQEPTTIFRRSIDSQEISLLRTHPTIWGYLRAGVP